MEPDSVETGVLQSRNRLGRPTWTYSHSLDRAGVTPVVDTATDVAGPWTTGPGATALVSATRQDNGETVNLRTDFAGTHARQRLRLRVREAAP